MKATSCALLLCLGPLLAGCGQKGPLYLPGQAPQSPSRAPLGGASDRGDNAGPSDAGPGAGAASDGATR